MPEPLILGTRGSIRADAEPARCRRDHGSDGRAGRTADHLYPGRPEPDPAPRATGWEGLVHPRTRRGSSGWEPRSRRPLAQGPAHRRSGWPGHRRDAQARGPAGRLGRADCRRACGRRGRRDGVPPARCTGPPLRPDVRIEDIRGNVETRLAKRDAGRYDATILAMAGLRRLGIVREDVHPLTVEQMVPAVGQGVLGVQCRAGDARLLGLLAAIDDVETRRCATLERAFLAALGGGCNVPAGCHAWVDGGLLRAVAMAADDGSAEVRRVEWSGHEPVQIGQALAKALARA